MRHLINYKIFESEDIKGISKKLHELQRRAREEKIAIKTKLIKDREDVFKELKIRIDECVYGLIDDFEYSFNHDKKYLYCFYIFQLPINEVDKFLTELENSIQKIKLLELKHELDVTQYREHGFSGHILNEGDFEELKESLKEATEETYRNNPIKKFEVKLSIFD